MGNKEYKSNSKLKVVIAALAVSLAGSLAYNHKITSDGNAVQSKLSGALSEKDSVMIDLQKLKTTYDAVIAENGSMSEKLMAEREKVIRFMNELEKSKGDVSTYKSQYAKLQNNMKVLMAENETLKKQNGVLTVQRNGTIIDLKEARKYNKVIISHYGELINTIEKGSKLNVLNMKTVAYKIKSSGKQIQTDKAGSTDVLRISFTIAENKIAKSGEKEYYVQVIDSKSNILGDKKSVDFDKKTLTYSFIARVKYENKTVEVSQDLQGKEFAKGTYFVNVFDKSELVSNTSFSLR